MRGEKGLSLVEVLVAVTVMTLAAIVALLVYDASRKSFKKGENATEQQQAVRIAFDRLSADIRLSGFNHNPDGLRDQPDEPIEAAYDTAIVLRADLDIEDPSESTVPETLLAGGARPVVSIGNDEIIAYVLAKPDGSSPDTLTFVADVKDAPRDGLVETVRIPNVALVQDRPPYTLYRISLNNDTRTWGTNGFFVRTPLIDNVRSLTFRYNSRDAVLNAAFDLTSISDDIGGADSPAAKRLRSSIERIEIRLEGLTRDPDLGWRDPADPDPATASYRKFVLQGDVTPRNLGKRGLQDLHWDVVPPLRPSPPTLVPGHCRGLWVSWPPNPAADRVAAYRVNFGTQAGRPTGARTVSATGIYLDRLAHAIPHFVTVQAGDASGNWSPPSEERSVTLNDVNWPEQPTNIRATRDQQNQITITWNAVTRNSERQPAEDPMVPMIRDLAGYRLYRGPRPFFDLNETGVLLLADERALPPQPFPSFTDNAVVNCRDYHYRVISADFCQKTNSTYETGTGRAVTTIVPAPPAGARAHFESGFVRVAWEAVTADAAGSPIHIETYNVYRSDVVPAGSGPPPDSSYAYIGSNTPGETRFRDAAPPALPPASAVYYRVRALDACNPPNLSAFSQPASPECAFGGIVKFDLPGTDRPATPVRIQVSVQGGSDTYAGVTLEFLSESDGRTDTVRLTGPGPWIHDDWRPAYGWHTIKATVVSTAGCTDYATKRVEVRP